MARTSIDLTDAELTSTGASALVEASPDGLLVVDEAGLVLMANRTLEDMFGYDRSELVGRPVEMLVGDRHRQAHAALRTRYGATPAQRPMGAGRGLHGRRSDGTEFPVDISLAPIETDSGLRVIACVRDATERARAEARMRMLSETMDALHDAVFMFDPESLRFGYVNDGAVAQTGYSREQLLTMTPPHIQPEVSQPDLRRMLEPLLAGQVAQHEFATLHRRRDGADIPVEVVLGYPEQVDSARLRSVVAVVRDVSERRAAELARRRNESWLDALASLREAFLRDQPQAAVLSSVCGRACDLVGGRSGTVLLLERDGQSLRRVASEGGAGDEPPVETVPVDATISGTVVETGTTVSVDDLSSDPRVAGPLLTGRGPAIFAPMCAEERVLGVLVIAAEVERGPFAPEEVAIIESFATEVAIAMALGEARAGRARLTVLEERERIAADLHDRVIQRLFATGMGLQATAGRIADEQIGRRLETAVDELDQTISELRSTIFHLSDTTRAVPFSEQILSVVGRYTAQLGFAADVQLTGDIDGLPTEVFEQLVPTLEEALSNISRHAESASAAVGLSVDHEESRLVVSDDGIGLPSDVVPGTGLKSLRARAERLGGTFDVAGARGGGTVLTWRVPV